MNRSILSEAEKLNMERRRRRGRYRAVSAMAAVVVFVTTYALFLPAISMEQETLCGLAEHTHTEACYYVPALNTGQDLRCGFTPHTHGALCYGPDGALTCGEADLAIHAHGPECFDGSGVLICPLEEHLPHIHTDGCWLEQVSYACGQTAGAGGHVHGPECSDDSGLICTLEEGEGHVHGEACGESISRELVCTAEEVVPHVHEAACCNEAGERICGLLQILEHRHDDACLAEHTHTEACYAPGETQDVLICPYHVHEEGCYDPDGQQVCALPSLICGMEEHIHSEGCFPEEEDGTVEVTFEVPEAYLPYVQSDHAFPLTYTLPEGSALCAGGMMPELCVADPGSSDAVYLAEYHWIAPDGFPVDAAAALTEDMTLTLRLYPADDPEAAQLVTAVFLCEEEVLLTRTVPVGTPVSDVITAEVQEALRARDTERRRFAGWACAAEDGTDVLTDLSGAVLEQDTTYCAVFRDHVQVTLHDIDPDGAEYPGSPMTVWLPVGSTLSDSGLILHDGADAAACRWVTRMGMPFDAGTSLDEDVRLYTYSYALRLNMTPAEEPPPEEEPAEEAAPEASPVEGMPVDGAPAESSSGEETTTPALLRFLARSPASAASSEGEQTEETTDEIVSIVKRSGEALTESDFVVDGVDYGAYQWLDDAGNEVDTDGLTGTALTANYALTRAAATQYTISYNINVSANSVFGTAPTVDGQTRLNDTYSSDDGSYIIRIPTPPNYMVTSGNKRTLYQFNGWKISRTGKTVAAGEVVDASWMSTNANRSSTTVTLTAQWKAVDVKETVHFFVNVNCQVTDLQGNTEIPSAGDYTPSVFSTTMSVTGSDMSRYWQGTVLGGSQYILFRAEKATDTELMDSQLRRLINGYDSTYDAVNGVSVWKSGYKGTKVFQVDDFPSDEHVLSVVRSMVESGTVIRMNGVPLNAEDLTAENFTVRWNVCKYDTGDGWHIDGVLVGKQGYLTVKKTFLGDDEAVQAVKDGGFTITIDDLTNQSAQNITLTLDPDRAETGSSRYGYTAYDAASDTYTWTLPLEQNHRYAVIENNYASADEAVQTSVSYTISNSPAAFSGWAVYPEQGVQDILAYAYASDVVDVGYQTVALRNSYVKADTLTIHKIDMDTGNGLAGVSYRLTDIGGNELTLYKKPGASYYSMKEEDLAAGFEACGDSIITTGSNGTIFLKLDTGTFILEEAFPTGYGGVSAITATVGADSSGNVTFEDVRSSDSTIEVDGILVDAHTATLTIRNVSQPTSVTAQKIWADSKDVQEVTVALYRNGVAMGSEYQVVLDRSNNWTHTWEDLPLYADGAAANYSLREVKIGEINYDPSADTDGYAGWLVTYDSLIYFKNGTQVSGPVWVDERGVTQYADNARLVVRNEAYRGQLVFLKVDGNGNPLAGATFRLYADEARTKILAEATSDERGRVIFQNLMPDTYYVIKESGTPDGYLDDDSVYKVRMSPQGSTTIEDVETGESLTAIVNYADQVEVRLYKVSELEKALAGAQFLLEQQIDGIWTVLGEYETGTDGLISFGSLASGSYRLTETKPPTGYMPLDEPIEFTVGEGKLNIAQPRSLWGVQQEHDTGIYTITVINTTGYELPNTGGVTTAPFVCAGALLILFAGAALAWQKRRRGEGDPS